MAAGRPEGDGAFQNPTFLDIVNVDDDDDDTLNIIANHCSLQDYH